MIRNLSSDNKQENKIIWAVDPFEAVSELQLNVRNTLKALVHKTGAQIQPVYILTPTEINLSPEDGFALPVDHYLPSAEQTLRQMLKEVDLPHIIDPKVVVQSLSPNASAARLLSEFAVQAEANLIVVGTHGRSGVRRLLLGSFAETLLLNSEVPVITVGPTAKKLPDFRHILFPTNFAPGSKLVFKRVVEMAKTLGSRVTLFHSVPHPLEPIFQSGVYLLSGAWLPTESYPSDRIGKANERACKWARWATHQGVETDAVIDASSGNIAEFILDLAHSRQSSMIAMQSQTGRIVSALIGSITREVIRHADCPVWAIHDRKSTLRKEITQRSGNQHSAA